MTTVSSNTPSAAGLSLSHRKRCAQRHSTVGKESLLFCDLAIDDPTRLLDGCPPES
jgi:hypothetical protein